jgi:hypothetical protein
VCAYSEISRKMHVAPGSRKRVNLTGILYLIGMQRLNGRGACSSYLRKPAKARNLKRASKASLAFSIPFACIDFEVDRFVLFVLVDFGQNRPKWPFFYAKTGQQLGQNRPIWVYAVALFLNLSQAPHGFPQHLGEEEKFCGGALSGSPLQTNVSPPAKPPSWKNVNGIPCWRKQSAHSAWCQECKLFAMPSAQVERSRLMPYLSIATIRRCVPGSCVNQLKTHQAIAANPQSIAASTIAFSERPSRNSIGRDWLWI